MERANSATTATPAGDDGVVSQGGKAPAAKPPSSRAAAGLVARPTQPVWERAARRTAHWGLVTAGRPVYPARMLPSFLIVGAERCGTSSMFEELRRHPAVVSAILPRKEVHYFDYKYQHGLSWYQCHFPIKARAKLAARGTGVAPMAFEASPYYMFHPLAPERIQRDLPGVKLIVMLRDPVARAYSAHVMRIGRGYETEPFERALELEESRLAGEAERLVADPVPVYHQVLDFLGLPHIGRPVFERPSTRSRTPMADSVRVALEEHYRPHDERLAAWLGYEPSWRR